MTYTNFVALLRFWAQIQPRTCCNVFFLKKQNMLQC